MRFLIDECVGPSIAGWLRQLGHDVLSIYEEARGSDDDAILETAFADNRILITDDKDFGEMVFREGKLHRGVILLRLGDECYSSKIKVLERLLEQYSDQLPGNFAVVTEAAVRIVHLRDN
jgi:predicted nuclease of predicted toxin-antitoxin system